MNVRESKDRIGISGGPTTVSAVVQVQQLIESQGYVVDRFEADKMGGQTLESAIHTGQLAGVIEMALADLVSDLFGEPPLPTSHRLTAAAVTGLPMVIVPGGCDMVVTIAESRPIHCKEVDRLAKDIAQKASASRGPVSIVVPMGAWSEHAHSDPDVPRVFAASLQIWLSPAVRVVTMTCDLGSPELAARTAEELACLIALGRRSASC